MSDAESDAESAPGWRLRADRPKHPDRRTVWRVLLAAIGLACVFPALDAAGGLFAAGWPQSPTAGSWLQVLPVVAAGTLVAAWIFVFWSLIGSFLNVVVHRLPLGQSVVHGGSRCPRCASPIKWHDNLPVIGWLNLDGHCRACGLPIAARYPIVEAICAGVATAVYCRELLSGGANLPGREPDFVHGGALHLFPNPGLDLVGLSLYHCGLLCVLLTWGLIARDGKRAPVRSVVVTVGVAAGLSLAFPLLHPLDLRATVVELEPAARAGMPAGSWLVQGLAVSLVGGLAGLACGLVLERLFGRLLRGDAAGRTGQPLSPPAVLGKGLALAGVVLGWQGMLGTVVILLAACLLQVLAWAAVRDWPVISVDLLLYPAAFVHLCFWRQLTERLAPWWPMAPTPACLALPAALTLAVAAAVVAITPAPGRPPRPMSDSGPADRGSSTATAGQPCHVDS